MRPKGTTRNIGASGGGYMTAGGAWVWSYWRNPAPFIGSNGAKARRNRRRDIRKHGYAHMVGVWTEADFSPLEWMEARRRAEVAK